jgi:hypothetical protein
MLSDPDDKAVMTLADGSEITIVLSNDSEKNGSIVMRCITFLDSTLWIFEQNIFIGLLEENNVCDSDFQVTHSVSIERAGL